MGRRGLGTKEEEEEEEDEEDEEEEEEVLEPYRRPTLQ